MSSEAPAYLLTPNPNSTYEVTPLTGNWSSVLEAAQQQPAADALAAMATSAPTTFDVVEAYAHVYQLPYASYIYVYIMWITFAVLFVLFAVFHQTGGRVGYVGSLWNKWLLRRRTWRKKHSLMKAMKAGKKHSQPFSLPSNAQLLCITFLWVFAILLSFVGPDYIVRNRADTFTKPYIAKRNLATSALQGNVFHETIQKSWWTSSARLGIISLTLFPLCVMFVTKAPPFALLAAPYLVQIWNDKLVFLHKWTGRLIYFITSIHVVFWSVQLAQDRISATDNNDVWTVIFLHVPFIYAWVAFIFFTILMVLSLKPVRALSFEFFYIAHVLLVPLVLIFAALHFPRLQWWSWVTLIVWGSERIYRFAKLLWANGIITNIRNAPMTQRYIDFVQNEQAGTMDVHRLKVPPFASQTFDNEDKKKSWASDSPTLALEKSEERPCAARRPGYSYRGTYIPPPGYAHVVLLPGKTVRVRLVLPQYFSWAPGQHVLLTVPAVSAWQSHPFTVSSACNQGSAGTDAQDVVLVIRAQSGFTKNLYDHVEKLRAGDSRGDQPDFPFIPPNEGVLLRAYVGGPFGSSVRVRWTTYSTVVIIAGGSGCSYAASVLEHVTACIAGKKDMTLAGRENAGQIKRVRFVWLVREFAYMQWIASMVRRCIERVPAGTLQVDIYVTNTMSMKAGKRLSPSKRFTVDSLHPGHANILGYGNESKASIATTDTAYSDVEANFGEVDDIINSYGELGHEEHVLDMTNYGGEDDTMMPSEREFSRQLQTEGEMRRAETHMRKSMLLTGSGSGPKAPPPTYHKQAFEDEATMEKGIGHHRTMSTPMPGSEGRPNPTPCSGFVSDLREADDMFYLSENAHSGRPKLNEIIGEEASNCIGSNMLVCCCGPTALIATIRKHVAENIKPKLVLEGKAPAITLASEEFEN
ncbi:hypothetical protein Clacol_008547 [Clathrus columnatus]|uniref:ferric-chelate reductase (NADPH) n=1 Tax=Clathrus columnatus TaxID=1419009 RepID=A0AAV5ALD8_9AGAM|nr:hypothetical protein Clacol_008547 [Clathrus columnatus]